MVATADATAAPQAATSSLMADKRVSDSSLEPVSSEKRKAPALAATAATSSSAGLPNQASKKGASADALKFDDVPLDKVSFFQRMKTFGRSFKYLYRLSPKQMEEFMDSYVIYSLDWADEEAMIAALGPNYQERVGACLRSYYGVLNHLCALGEIEKMYIPPYMDGRATVTQNQLLYERAVAGAIGAKPGMRLLDLGCGRGRVAAHMTTATGAFVTGLNIDPDQISSAREYATKHGLTENNFVIQDMNDGPLPFEDESFDGFYQIQAMSLCKDLPFMFREIFRVLKPGAKLSLLDWVSFPTYDPTNPEHAELMRRVKPLIGAVGTPTPTSFERDIRAAGFTVTKSENASVGGLQSPLIGTVDGYFRFMRSLIHGLVKVRVLPQHFRTLFDRFCLDGEAFVKMDEMRLITTSYWIVAEKPVAAAATTADPATTEATVDSATTAVEAPAASAVDAAAQ
ncbi:hypothetical protein P8C59_006958 [Phyllachora maydis]|uniref:Methyltransferase domain-containing protein n=1 Tax=Phyllachora maydis TaxID=1825666 RepID=A0AAD9MHH0_9PEZI|nr:hypothetical protein P8C59_006958 [Phyllachora maydis]